MRRDENVQLIESQLISLDDIAEKYGIVLVDNCCINKYVTLNKRLPSSRKNEIDAIGAIFSAVESHGNIYLTEKVLEEFMRHYVLNGCSSIVEGMLRWKARERFAEKMKDHGLVSDFREIENYDTCYDSLKRVEQSGPYGKLSLTDSELLEVGYRLAKGGTKAALISNDKDIGRTWQEIMRIEKENKDISPKRYGMFWRRSMGGRAYQGIGLDDVI